LTSIDLKSTKILMGLVLLATAVVYGNSLWFEFTYDDQAQIIENRAITSASHIREYFTTHVWANIFPEALGNYYRPVFLLWLLLNYKLFGLSPGGWHATNLLVHLLCTWLVFVLAKRLTKDDLIAVVAAFLFGIHPVHLESVAWVSGVTDPLMTFFIIAAFVTYLDSGLVSNVEEETSTAKPPDRPVFRTPFFLSLLFFSLALLTKETAIVFPLLVLCYQLLMVRGTSPRRRLILIVRALIPYLILTGVYLIVRVKVLGVLGHQITPLPITTVVLTIPYVLWFYVNHLVWPFPLSVFYETSYVSGGWLFWGPLVGLIVLVTICFVLARQYPVVLFLAGWILVPILPLLNLSQFYRGEIVHDRYLYLPSVGYCIILSVALIYVIRNHARYKVPAMALLCLIGAAYLLETVIELPQWKNDLALYTHAAAVAPHSNLAINNYATALKFEGELDRAIDLYKDLLVRDPNNWLVYYNLGYCYYKQGSLDEAINYLAQAIERKPRDPESYAYYGLAAMGKGDTERAEMAMRKAIELRPANARYHFALGVLLQQKQDLAGARAELTRSIELDRAIESNARPLLAEIEAKERGNR